MTQKRQASYVLHHFQANVSEDQNLADYHPLPQLRVQNAALPLSGLFVAIEKIKAQLKDSTTNHRFWKVALFLIFCPFLLGACQSRQSSAKPVIEFTNVPLAEAGGLDKFDTIEGRVIDASPGQRVVLYARSGAWYVQPCADQAFTKIQANSTWRSSTHFGTEYAALLVKADYRPPSSTDVLPVEGSPRPLHPLIRDEVYRIGRETLVNVFRHSQAHNIEVEVRYESNQLQMLIRDDGCGINPQVLRSGREGHWGLSGMREQSERIGARFKVRSRMATGTEVELSMPGTIIYESRSEDRLLKWFTSFQPNNIRARFRKQKIEAKQ